MSGKQLYLFSHRKDNEKGGSRPKVILPLDTLILLGVIAILLFTISFSIGVERGKGIGPGVKNAKENIVSPTQSPDTISTRNINIDKDANDNQQPKERVEEENESYHVQVASFKKEISALKEVKRLEEGGYPVRIMKKGDYVVIYVGGFKNEGEAQSNFKDLKKKYKDCIFRKSL
ncbi:MAG: SPOR domain-containing protein [Candidatus Omnitrophica bacterium]|nr:SPOR domain-containing protein [Candidatus Omnitrophota bacterium]